MTIDNFYFLGNIFRYQKRLKIIVLTLLFIPIFFLTAMDAKALEADKQEPIEIVADSNYVNMDTNEAIYTGNVLLTQGSIQLRASTLTIKLNDKKIKTIMAYGKPAKFQQQTEDRGLMKGQANHLEYKAQQQKVNLYGSAKLQQEDSTWTGEVLNYNMATGSGESNERSTTVIPSKFLEQK